jgi:hypothetical protein
LSLPSSSISSSSMIPLSAMSSMGKVFSSAPSVSSLNTSSNRLFSMQSGMRCFFAFGQGGGGNRGSIAILQYIVIHLLTSLRSRSCTGSVWIGRAQTVRGRGWC